MCKNFSILFYFLISGQNLSSVSDGTYKFWVMLEKVKIWGPRGAERTSTVGNSRHRIQAQNAMVRTSLPKVTLETWSCIWQYWKALKTLKNANGLCISHETTAHSFKRAKPVPPFSLASCSTVWPLLVVTLPQWCHTLLCYTAKADVSWAQPVSTLQGCTKSWTKLTSFLRESPRFSCLVMVMENKPIYPGKAESLSKIK